MTDNVYKKIKRQNGERFAQTLRNYHSALLEIDGIAEMVRYAGRDAAPLLPYLMSLLAANDDIAPAVPQNPFALLAEAGYDAFHADSLEKQNSIMKYFAQGELLCTFNDAARHHYYHIVHAVKKDAGLIRREDFKGKEQRQDAYGTSVISIQMLKKGGFISIKNRYNHAVTACDNTFDSNPDNIICGLSAALQKHFNVAFAATKSPLPDNFTLIDGRIFKYGIELNNIYYGDQAWARNGVIHAIDRSGGNALFDCYLFDNKTKALRHIDPAASDSFPADFNRAYGGHRGLRVQNGDLMLDNAVLIGAEASGITKLDLPNLTALGDCGLYSAISLKEFHVPLLQSMGDMCLSVTTLSSFNAPSLTTMGNSCLTDARELTTFDAPVLAQMEEACLRNAPTLATFHAPALRTMGNSCLEYAQSLSHFDVASLQSIGDRCLMEADALGRFEAPALTTMGASCLATCRSLKEFDAPVLRDAGDSCLYSADSLVQFRAPALTTIGDSFLRHADSVVEIDLPELVIMSSHSLRSPLSLRRISAPKLTTIEEDCLRWAPSLQELYAPALKALGIGALHSSPQLVRACFPDLGKDAHKKGLVTQVKSALRRAIPISRGPISRGRGNATP